MTNGSIVYFERVGRSNTVETVRLAHKRALELGIRDIVVASSFGRTALECAKEFDELEYNLVAVSLSEGYKEKGWTMSESQKAHLTAKSIKVLTGTHALGGDVGAAFAERFGAETITDIICQTLYRFGEGMKVCVEIVLMAADAGLIPGNKEVIAIAGTGGGADTAIVVKSSYTRKFHEMKILEIIAKPRDVNLKKIEKEGKMFRK